MLELTEMLGVKIDSKPWDEADGLPYFLVEMYNFRKVYIDGIPCIFAEPRAEIPAIQSVLKHFSTAYAVSSLPVVLKVTGLSAKRRKALIAAHIPFVADGQVYLPFIGVALQNRLYNEPSPREKLMPSSQLLLFYYLYQNDSKMYTSQVSDKIGVSAMQVTRAVRQLQKLGFFEVYKEGVQVVIEGKASHRTLFEESSKYLIDPVCEILYIPRDEKTVNMPFAGLSALSDMSMLAAPEVPTYAYFSKTDKIFGESGLIDQKNQARIEVWKYNPSLLSSKKDTADILSVIVSLRNERSDERIEQAIEGILSKLWR